MYPHLFVAGTFDGLHAGHRAVLTRAFRVGEKVTIGLTSDAFVRTYKLVIRPYGERKKDLERWLENQKKQVTIITIDDPYEPAASMKGLDALIVTAENRKTGEHINVLRQGSTLPCLTLIEVSMVPAEDGTPVSSTRMRNGEIDHEGRLIMPESLRVLLGKPMGNVLSGKAIDGSIHRNKNKLIVTVGDIATKTFLDAGITPTLAIIDGMVGRKPFLEVVDRLTGATVVKSGPGYISREAVEAIRECFSCHVSRVTCHALFIDGEEDLLVLPVVQYAPLGAFVYYGQPGDGLVEVFITKIVKKKAEALLFRFT